MSATKIIVVGAANIDIFATGFDDFPLPGENTYVPEVKIAPGGKARNLAVMLARLSPSAEIYFVSKGSQDKYGFTDEIVASLAQEKINTDYFIIDPSTSLPGTAIIPVSKSGEHQIFIHPGIVHTMSEAEIMRASAIRQDEHEEIFVAISGELSQEQEQSALKLAQLLNARVVIDPGGIRTAAELELYHNLGIFLLKPNEHEAKIITGVEVTDSDSAHLACDKLHELGFANVLLTVGSEGAYVSGGGKFAHIPLPHAVVADFADGQTRDATGAGDQALAGFMATYRTGHNLLEAANAAVVAGTLQFFKPGITPISLAELRQYL